MQKESGPRYDVLYLEDEFQNAAIDLSDIQQTLGVHITLAKTVEEAVQLIEAQHFDLFVLDIEIKNSRMTGIQLAEQLRQMPSHTTTPILFTSMHTHYSHWLFSKIRYCSFLAKPFTQGELTIEIGIALGIPKYIQSHYSAPSLFLPSAKGTYIEVSPLRISYIEITNRDLLIQYIDGESFQIKCPSGVLKNLLDQIETLHISCLRQIYRSIVINVNQIKKIELGKNTAHVFLFNEPQPLPLGMRYRENIQEFL